MKRRILPIVLLLLPGWLPALAIAAPDWDQLAPDQQRILGELKLAERWDDLPDARRERLLKGLSHWQKMTPEERRIARKNLKRWRKLPPERRKALRQRLQRYLQLPPDKRRLVRERAHQFRQLPPERREQLRERWRRFSPSYQQHTRERLLHGGHPFSRGPMGRGR
jgi:hypothetical protein